LVLDTACGLNQVLKQHARMNDPNPIVPPAPTPPAPACTDRSGGLVAFGVLTILLGASCGLMVKKYLRPRE
jgi:hypothetical protein